MIDYKQILKNYCALIGSILVLLFFILGTLFIVPLVNGDININPIYISETSICWNWSEINLTSVSVDGFIINNIDNETNFIQVNNLLPATPHIIKIYSNSSYGENISYTLGTEKTSKEVLSDLILTYIILICAVVFIVMSIWIPVFSIISLVLGIINLVFAIKSGNFDLDMISAMIILASSLMIYRGAKP